MENKRMFTLKELARFKKAYDASNFICSACEEWIIEMQIKVSSTNLN